MTEVNDSVFNVDKTQGTEAVQAQTNTSLVEQLVGEGKRFKDVEVLAKSKLESDKFIDHLTTELREIREELSHKLTTEEILKNLDTKGNQSKEATKVDNYGVASQEELAKLIRSEMDNKEKQSIMNRNIVEADSFISERLGGEAKAKEFIAAKCRELGCKPDYLLDMASTSPKALYRVLGLDVQTTGNTPDKTTSVQGTQDTSKLNLNNPQLQEGTKAYFDAIRKQDKRRYFSKEVQTKLFEAKRSGAYDK